MLVVEVINSFSKQESIFSYWSFIEFEHNTVAGKSGYCDLNKRGWDLHQSKDDSFVKRVAKNSNWNNGGRHKIHEIFLINCLVFVITLVWKTLHSSTMTQIESHLMEKNIATNCSYVKIPVLVGWRKKPFGHYAILNFFPLDHQVPTVARFVQHQICVKDHKLQGERNIILMYQLIACIWLWLCLGYLIQKWHWKKFVLFQSML